MRISKSGPALPLKKLKKPNIPKSEEVQEVVLEPVAMVAVGGMAVVGTMEVMPMVPALVTCPIRVPVRALSAADAGASMAGGAARVEKGEARRRRGAPDTGTTL